jgi:hypothetical protein
LYKYKSFMGILNRCKIVWVCFYLLFCFNEPMFVGVVSLPVKPSINEYSSPVFGLPCF